MAWDVRYANGVYLPKIDWWLDAHFPVSRAFVSHAHFDHLAPHALVLASEGTARLMRARMPAERREIILPFGEPHDLHPGVTATLHPAGHIFGSAQIHLAHEEMGTLLYTGDFKLRPGLSAEPCATPPAETLIMETTFGLPRYVFPPTAEVLQRIAQFCRDALGDGETPVLFGYSLGKSQELLQGLAAADLPIMLHPQTYRLTKIYEELGLAFPAHRAFSTEELPGHVVICPPQSNQSSWLRKIARRRTAVITGWALDAGAIYRYQCDAAFPLSDHADFADLLRFVELVNPRRVLTLHGFSREFARTLRDRGLEAWAVNQDNQLELTLAASGSPPAGAAARLPAESTRPAAAPEERREAAGDPRPESASPETSPDDFVHFAQAAESVRATAAKLEKVARLQRYLAGLSPEDAGRAALFFTGRTFPQASGRALNLGWSILKRAVLQVSGHNEGDFRDAYQRFSDSGDTAEALLDGRTRPERWTLAEAADLFEELAAARGPVAKMERLQARLARLSPLAAKYLVKIITGDLRIGLKEGLVEEAVALASGQTPEAVREAHLLSGDIREVARAARLGQLTGIQLAVFHPLQFMLASPEPTAEAIVERLSPPIWLEEKYDGIRCQVHKRGDRVELYSRDLRPLTGQFPDVARAVARHPRDFILDGELLAWRDNRALPFAELQKRLGRKGDDFFLGAEIPVSVTGYDLLWLDGRSLLNEPLRERRRLLEELLRETAASPASDSTALVLAPLLTAQSALDIEAAFLRARQRGNEGLMAKDPESVYRPGRRGLSWLKLKKAYATLDVVVIGAEYGHGKRREVLSDYTFAVRDEEGDRLLAVGKAYSGLTDKEITELTARFLDDTLEVHGRYRTVKPEVVLEVAFDTIQPSRRHASGYALRFPRIVRIRTDKTPAEIDTLAHCRRLADATLQPGSETPAAARV